MQDQEIFDAVVKGLAAQGHRSTTLGAAKDQFSSIGPVVKCAYRGDNGRRCAVGMLMTDEQVALIGNSEAIGTLTEFELQEAFPQWFADAALKGLLGALQYAHDAATADYSTDEFTSVWGDKGVATLLLKVAKTYRLSPALVYAYFPGYPDALPEVARGERPMDDEEVLSSCMIAALNNFYKTLTAPKIPKALAVNIEPPLPALVE